MNVIATGIPSMLHTVAHTPDIWCVVDAVHNAAMAETFARAGPYGLVKEWVLPAAEAGCTHAVFRWLSCPWDWLDSLGEAMDALAPAVVPVLYINPWASGLNLSTLKRLMDWCLNFSSLIALEQVTEYFWVRNALHSVGLLACQEPAVGVLDTDGLKYPVVIEDREWARASALNWVGQMNPTLAPFHRWFCLTPGDEVLPAVRSHYKWLREHPKSVAGWYPADYFRQVGEGGYGVTVELIRA